MFSIDRKLGGDELKNFFSDELKSELRSDGEGVGDEEIRIGFKIKLFKFFKTT